MRKLRRSFYARPTLVVAQELLSKLLVHGTRVVRIVETEAYLGPHDLACHSARGMTARNAPMFGPPGHAYVYMIYGMYFCLNVVTEGEGRGCAVLIRSAEPVRGVTGKTNGPGLLCRAMSIDRRLNGHDLLSDDFYIARDVHNKDAPEGAASSVHFKIVKRPRVGVAYAGQWARRLLRFYIAGNPFVSRK